MSDKRVLDFPDRELEAVRRQLIIANFEDEVYFKWGRVVTPQSLESQEKKEDLNFEGRLGESMEGLGESKRDPGR